MSRASAIVVGLFLTTVLLALPLVIAIRAAIGAHLDDSFAGAPAAAGVNWDWWQEFSAQARGLDSTFSPSIIGFAATLSNLSRLLDGQGQVVPVMAALALYLAGWIFLSGGIIDRYARQRPTHAHGFFAASGVHFFRFARLALAAGIAYWWLFAYVHPWLLDRLYENLTRDLSVERVAFFVRFSLYGVFGALLVAVNLLVDYAKLRIVVEDRHSALGALTASYRFVRHRWREALGLYALNGVVFVAVIAVWALVSPGATGAGFGMWAAFATSQLFILARLLLKLQFIASQTSLFQATLAHARYVSAPAAVWPESPAAEAIGPAPR